MGQTIRRLRPIALGGFRTIIAYHVRERSIFLYGFAKIDGQNTPSSVLRSPLISLSVEKQNYTAQLLASPFTTGQFQYFAMEKFTNE